jgi:hypothetical protein
LAEFSSLNDVELAAPDAAKTPGASNGDASTISSADAAALAVFLIQLLG